MAERHRDTWNAVGAARTPRWARTKTDLQSLMSPLFEPNLPSWLRHFIANCPPATFSNIEYFYELLKEIHILETVQANSLWKFPNMIELATKKALLLWHTISPSNSSSYFILLLSKMVNAQAAVPMGVVLEEKISIADNRDCVARIIGHRGANIKHLQTSTGCYIAIRGKGSVKDETEESRLVGRRGWEHLNEELHVYIRAEDRKHASCAERLALAKLLIKGILACDAETRHSSPPSAARDWNDNDTDHRRRGDASEGFQKMPQSPSFEDGCESGKMVDGQSPQSLVDDRCFYDSRQVKVSFGRRNDEGAKRVEFTSPAFVDSSDCKRRRWASQ